MFTYATFNQQMPAEGPRSISYKVFPELLDANNPFIPIDLTAATEQNIICGIQGVYIDNLQNDGDLMMVIPSTGQRIFINANSCGYYPIITTAPNIFQILAAPNNPGGQLNNIMNLLFYNVPIPPYVYYGSGSPD